MQEVVIADGPELPGIAAERIAGLLRAAMTDGVSLALAGGSTPRATYEQLSLRSDVPWRGLAIYFGDERCVPPDHPDSNYRMAKEALLDRTPIVERQVRRMLAELEDHEAAARAYEALLPAAVDVLVLGIGEDGHTASLFPGAPSLAERDRRVVAVVGPKPPAHRLTITPRVIEGARAVVMIAGGAAKAEAVRRALEGDWDPERTPAQFARNGLWVLDRAAASGLTHRRLAGAREVP